MASAAPSPLASSVEKTNGAKLSRLLIDGGTEVLRKLFDRCHPPATLAASLDGYHGTLHDLREGGYLHPPQWKKLFPRRGAQPADSRNFDITLLFLLLTNICRLSPPDGGWHTKPRHGDHSRGADILRIKFYRNEVYGHVTTTGIDTPRFSVLWEKISACLKRLGLKSKEIDRLKAEHCGEEEYIDLLCKWADSEKDIKSQLKDVQTKVQKSVDQVHATLRHSKETLKEVHQSQTKLNQTVGDNQKTLQDSRTKLDEIHQTAKTTHHVVTEARLTQLEVSSAIRDTKSNVEEVRESLQTLKQEIKREDERRGDDEILKKLARIDTLKVVSYHADRYVDGTRLPIFEQVDRWLDDRSSPSRVMVISGNAGMGKSVIAGVICRKMQRAGRLSGLHFCQHNKARHRNPKVMLQSLACQLSDCLPEYKNALVDKLSRNLGEEINNMEVGELFELLFEEPLLGLSDPGSIHLMVIDGLDESEYHGRNELLDVIADYFEKLPHWVRFLVTTRPEINISERLQDLNPIQLKPDGQDNLEDIRICFKEQLKHVLQLECQERILEKLVEKSEGVMLYMYYLIDFIKENARRMSPDELVDSGLPSGISSVYQVYFKRLKTELEKEVGITEVQFFDFLNAIVAAKEPLPVDFVYKLFLSGEWSSAGQQKVRDAIDCISALLPIEGECIHFFHKSVKDWLIEKSSSRQKTFTVDERQCHRILSKLCTEELDGVKLKGIHSAKFKDTTMYALQYGVQHVLEVEENARPCSLEEVVKKYVLDLELVYAKLCVNSTSPIEDVLFVQEQQGINTFFGEYQKALGTLLFLLRKHISTLTELPRAIFQTLLNEGGSELSCEALSLLNTKYCDIPYMEYLQKKDPPAAVQMRFYGSDQIACFDVSPNLDYMVCECKDGTIHLWSLRTAKKLWKRAVEVSKREYDFWGYGTAYRWAEGSCTLSFYRSVVFHPTLNLILPGILSQAYTVAGDLKPLFLTSKCRFEVCSISGDKTTILTDCLGRKCIIQWSLKDGTEITRFEHNKEILSFAWSPDGRLIAISDSACYISLVDAVDGFKTLVQTYTLTECRMLKITPDCRFLFGFHGCQEEDHPFPVDLMLLCLDVKRDTVAKYYNFTSYTEKHFHYTREFESCNECGFLSGDPFWYPFRSRNYALIAEFALVLNKQFVLTVSPFTNVIEMFNLSDIRERRGEFSDEAKQRAELGDLPEQRVELENVAEQRVKIDDLLVQQTELDDLSEQAVELDDLPEQGVELDYLPEQGVELDDLSEQGPAAFDDLLEGRAARYNLAERDDPDDLEHRGALLEDLEEKSVDEVCDQTIWSTVHNVVFSVNGDALYVVLGSTIQRINLMTWDISSKKYKGDRYLGSLGIFSLLPVKRGVLFQRNSFSLELWNSELSECIQSWTDFYFRSIAPISEERVGLETWNSSESKPEVVILDTTSGDIVSTIRNFDGNYLACNSKCEVLTTTYRNSLQLRRDDIVLWDNSLPLDLQAIFTHVVFSPTDRFFVISGISYDSCYTLYVFGTVSGRALHMLCLLKYGLYHAVPRCEFVSDDECVVNFHDKSKGACLRLYNANSGELLSEIVEEREVSCLAASPIKRLVAIGFENSKNKFEIIQVKLPGDKERRYNQRFKLQE